MNDLFDIAATDGIEVIYKNVPASGSISMDGYICMDYSLLCGGADERVHLAHEIGHCVTGAFYNRFSPNDIRQRYENRADRWAINELIPENKLIEAIETGHTEPWDLAEYFNVTQPFIEKAIGYYQMKEAQI